MSLSTPVNIQRDITMQDVPSAVAPDLASDRVLLKHGRPPPSFPGRQLEGVMLAERTQYVNSSGAKASRVVITAGVCAQVLRCAVVIGSCLNFAISNSGTEVCTIRLLLFFQGPMKRVKGGCSDLVHLHIMGREHNPSTCCWWLSFFLLLAN